MIIDFIHAEFGERRYSIDDADLDRSRALVLYHGTSSVFLDSILRFGILPSDSTGNSVYANKYWGTRPLASKLGHVYFTCQGHVGLPAIRAVQKYGGERIAVRAVVPIDDLLAPDEDSRTRTWRDSLARIATLARTTALPAKNILGWGLIGNNCDLLYTRIRPAPIDTIPRVYGECHPQFVPKRVASKTLPR